MQEEGNTPSEHTPMKWAPIVYGKPGTRYGEHQTLIDPLSRYPEEERKQLFEWIWNTRRAAQELYGGELTSSGDKKNIPFIFSRHGRFTLVGIYARSKDITDDITINLEFAPHSEYVAGRGKVTYTEASGREYGAAMFFLAEGSLTEVPIFDPEFYRNEYTTRVKEFFNYEEGVYDTLAKLAPSTFNTTIPTRPLNEVLAHKPIDIKQGLLSPQYWEDPLSFSQLIESAALTNKPITVAYCERSAGPYEFEKNNGYREVHVLGNKSYRDKPCWYFSGIQKQHTPYPALGNIPSLPIKPKEAPIKNIPSQTVEAEPTGNELVEPVSHNEPICNNEPVSDNEPVVSSRRRERKKAENDKATLAAAAGAGALAFKGGKYLSTALAIFSPIAIIDGLRRLLKKPETEEQSHSSNDKIIGFLEVLGGIAGGIYAYKGLRGR